MTLSAGLAAFCRAHNVQTPEGAVRGAWAKVLQTLRLSKPPTPLKPVCDALQVAVHWKNESSRAMRGNASLAVEADQLTIRVHRRSPTAWRHNRFLIAHELTHALLLRLLREPSLIDSLDSTRTDLLSLERVCDLGAHELLMPSTPFRASMARQPLGPEALRALHDEYLVTLGAAADRVAYLTPRTALLRMRKFARSTSEETAWRVVSCFPRYARDGMRPWLPQGATLKHLPSIDDLDSIVGTQEVREGRTSVVVSGRTWRTEFTAFAVPLPRTEVLSLPMFEQFSVPDEPIPRSRDVLVFLQEAELIEPRSKARRVRTDDK